MKYSLHIGLNVVDPAAYYGWPGNLAGCVADCAALASVLARAGFAASALINEEATNNALTSRINDLAASAQSGDQVVIHNSSHGGRQDFGLFGGFHETICLYDGELLDTAYRDLIARFRNGVRVITIADSCHSGGMDRGHRASKARPAYLRPHLFAATKGARNVEACWAHIAACRHDETAGESYVEEVGEVRGALTWSLCSGLESLRVNGQTMDWHTAYGVAASFAARQFPQQHPRAVSDGDNPELAWKSLIA